MARVRAGGDGFLRVFELAGDGLALGRYHLAPARGEPIAHRRLSGGRAMPAGRGFTELSLVLPHRSALVSDDPHALAPEQVMNRCVRGLLDALGAVGLAPIYPGLDTITVGRRTIGGLAFEVDPHGVLLFTATLARARDFSELPVLLERADPGGVVTAALLTPDHATSLARELGRAPSFDEVSTLVAEGYRRRFGIALEAGSCSPPPAALDASWLAQRAASGTHDRHGRSAVLLGALEAHFRLEHGRLRDVVLAGDLIAASGGVAALERALDGCRAERQAIAAVVEGVVRPPSRFILGIGPLMTVTETIMRGLG